MAHGPGEAYERMLAVAVGALHEREPERLWPLLAGALPDLCGGELLVYKLDDWSERAGTVGMSAGVAAQFDALGDEDLGLLRSGYPFADHYATGPDRTPHTARRAAGRGWSASPTARLLGATMDMDHVLALPLPQVTTPITGCMVYRSGKDFTEDQLRTAQRLQPLLAAVDQQRQLLEQWRHLADPAVVNEPVATGDLTPRETTVLLLLTDALTATAIGRRLGISDRTVHKHVENIYRKLGTRDRISTVLRAQQLGLVPTPALSRGRA
ncbi:DNA-binding CsgD family transcriptional regulator [Streptomyces pseudovenezuelae]|uniref:DNA-binding CsgD family transcriptional regulator n=2 Tax=Streptomyces pseudovenezuelae TaxID=67350 RepID=A0ABT6LQD3_9ACTN|nr:LuxR C-terminal-related transcriptional regulator [Streptomyces pseudovenezuelae]MDH6217871.1 DNA-binding CsgD family transcriptional regulator [Streptomyces pseudovenezuelae]